MKKKLYLLLLIVLPVAGYSQQAVPQILRTQQAIDRINSGALNGVQNSVYGIPAPPSQTVGDGYLDQKWNKGSIMLTQNETLIEGYPVKYDVKEKMVEIKGRDGIRILDVRKVKSLVWIDSLTQTPRYFVNASQYKDEGTPLVGLIEVVVDGNKPLLCLTSVHIKQPNYVPAFDVGDRNATMYKKQEFFYSVSGELKSIKSKKKFLEGLGANADQAGKFMKQNDLEVKERNDLRSLFEYLNTLESQGS
jgi:hypothetical protein